MPTITERIRAEFNKRREAKQITYQEAADKLGTGTATLYQFAMGGDMYSERVNRLARVLGMKLEISRKKS